jgi:thiol:disulfide interchange protein
MKLSILLIVFACFFAQNANAQNKPSIQWTSYSKALAQNKKDRKPIFIEFFAEWCAPCHVMERTTLRDSAVVHLLNTRFHAVRLDVDKPGNMLCEGSSISIEECVYNTWEIPGIPALATVNAQGNLLHSYVGMIDARDMELLLLGFLDKGPK